MDSNPDQAPQSPKQKKRKEMGELNRDILTLCSRGSAIIAEILRLKDYIPETYTNPSEEKIYADIIFDFKYFQGTNTQKFEDKIKELRNGILDEEKDISVIPLLVKSSSLACWIRLEVK